MKHKSNFKKNQVALKILFLTFFLCAGKMYSQNVVHYIPFPEQDLYNSFKSVTDADGASIAGPLKSVVSVVASENSTLIYYDEWEDGYEANITSPVQSTTKIFGDGNLANGNAASYCTSCTGDLVNSGSVLSLKNDVPIPRNPSVILFDGRDKIASTKYVSVSRSSYPVTPGTVLADATEVVDTTAFNHEYYIPIGVNMATAVDNDMFMLTHMYIMASKNGTSVQIDADANGSFETTVTINEGESYKVTSVNVNAHVVASKPVEIDLFCSRTGSSHKYENRWFTLYPYILWDNSYYAPMTTTTSDDPASVFIFNPKSSAITVYYTTRTGSGTLTVAANSTVRYDIPMGTGARFYTLSESDKFFAVGAMDTDVGNNATHDWGMTLLPESYLTTSVVCGWGPGSASPTVNGNPIWVCATAATTIYIDYDGDPSTGTLTDFAGNKYNVSYTLAAYQVKTVYDPDNDQTGMRIYTLDGTHLASCWGQDPSTAGCCDPYLDMGTTVSPDRRLTVSKLASLSYDQNSNGLIDPGDSIQYTIVLENFSLRARNVVTITDIISAYVTYRANTATKTTTNLSTGTSSTVAVPDNANPTTPFPLDEGGYLLGTLNGAIKIEVKYKVVANANVATQALVTNNVTVTTGGGETYTTKKDVPVNNSFTPCTINFTNSSWTTVTSYITNSTLYVSMTAAYLNTNISLAETAQVTVANTTNSDQETLTLTETGVNTGIFRGSIPSSITAGGSNGDGTLKAIAGDNLTVSYTNQFYDNTCTAAATMAVPSLTKPLYMSDSLITLGMDRILPWDGTASSTAVLSTTTGITVDNTTTATYAGNAASKTITHTTGTGANRLMLVGISVERDDPSSIDVTGVTLGGTAFTKVLEAAESGEAQAEIWRLVNPPSGSGTVTVTTSGGASTDAMVIGVVTFNGVNQTTPLDAFTTSTDGTSPATITVTTGTTGDLIFGVLAHDDARAVTSSTAGSQVQIWDRTLSQGTNDGVTGAASTKPGAASVTLSWTLDGGDDGTSIVAGPINPAAANATVSFTQNPAMCSALSIVNAGTVTATLYVTVASGTMPASPAITGVVKYGATTIANLTTAGYSGGVLTLTGTTSSAISVPAGQAIVLDVTTAQSGVTFTIDYDSQTKQSKISLPTTSVISVNSVNVYNAAYSGGSTVTSVDNGSIVYVRSVVSDPFGFYDITSMPLTITGPSSYSLSATATSVATSGCTRTYEYAWQTPTVEGIYNIEVTAKEGKENTVSDSKSTQLELKQTDVGTPCAAGFTDASWVSTSTYAANGTIYIQVTDADQNTNPASAETVSVTVTASPNGDVENVTLTETGVSTGIFRGSINSNATTNSSGVVYAPLGTAISLRYTDPNDAGDICNNAAAFPQPSPDPNGLILTKTRLTPSDGIAVIGEQITFKIEITNTGNQSVTQLTLTDTYPTSCLTYVSASTTPDATGSGSLTWNSSIVPIATGQTKTITLTFTANSACNPATNTAATANGQYSGGASVTNKTSSATVVTTRPDLSLTKTLITPGDGTAAIGEAIQYQIVVTNTGTTNLTNIPMNDTYSAYCMNYVSATPTPTGTGGGTLFWSNLASSPLAPGNSITITVNLTAYHGCGSTLNTAEIIGATDANGDNAPDKQASASVTTYEVTVTGNVYDDADGLTDNTVDGTGTNASGNVYANLVNASTNQVVASKLVNTDGTYSFGNDDGILINTNYTVILTSSATTPGAALTSSSLPANWVSTGEYLGTGTGNDGSVDGKLSVSVATTSVTNTNFGIDQLPNSNDNSASFANVCGSDRATIPTLSGTDPEDGALGSGGKIIITTLATNGTLYYNGTAVTLSQVISNYTPSLFTVDPSDGNYTVTFTYAFIDAANQQDPTPATVTLTFSDNTPPTISCPANITVSTNSGCTATGISLGIPVTNDNCSVAGTTNDHPSTTYPLGTTIVIWTVTDGSGNTATCNQVVTVNDNVPPSITCPSNAEALTDDGLCTSSSVILGTPATSDNCSVASVTNDHPSAIFTLGSTTVIWTVTDGSGNTATCSQIVTVNDNNPPSIDCPSNVIAYTNSGCLATGVSLGTPVTSDNCSVASVTNDAPADYPLGVTIVTWTVTDGTGNTSQCTQTVTVNDNIIPTISCPANLVLNTNSGCMATGVSPGTPATGDNCSVASVVNNHPSSIYPLGTTTVIWTVTDGSGNTATCAQTVTVNDNVAPTITCPSGVTVATNSGCTATGVSLGTPGTNDNCSVASTTNNHPSTTYPLGMTTVIWTVTDGSGNTATCAQTVTVNDNVAPTITCPSGVTVATNSGCTATGVSLGTPGTNDNCSVAGTTNNHPSTTYPLGTTTVIWTVTDGSGNTATCAQTVTVNDNVAPTITCPSGVTVATNSGCTATGVSLGTPVTNDNCSVAGTTNNHPSTTYPLGTTTVIWTVTDGSGNTASCSQTVTVNDNVPPLITCPAPVGVQADAGMCEATGVDPGTPVTSDNCSVAGVTNNHPSGTFPVGVTIIIWTVTDGSGNTATCSQTVTVTDTQIPSISCAVPSGSYPADNGTCTYTVPGTALDPTYSDNCTGSTVKNNLTNTNTLQGAVFPLGSTTVTWTVTDGSGNTATCNQNIQVTDTQNPSINCPAPAPSYLAQNGYYTVPDAGLDPSHADNCPGETVINSVSHTSTLMTMVFPIGSTNVIWTVTDASGNTATCSQNIIVTDLILNGIVFDDGNGLKDMTVNGTGTNASGLVYANLVNAATNLVTASVAVTTGGTYSFGTANGLQSNTDYHVILTMGSRTPGTLLTASTLPPSWVNTGENIGTTPGNDGIVNGILPVHIGTSNVNNANFGIDRLPSGAAYTASSRANPGGTVQTGVPVAAFTGTDPEDGTYTSGLNGRKVTLGPASGGVLYYDGTAVSSSTVISGFDPTKVAMDPDDGNVTVAFPYTVWDDADQPDPAPDTIKIPFINLILSGNVFNDADGLTDSKVDGTGTDAGGSLFVNLVNPSTNLVMSSKPVPGSGIYSFGSSDGLQYNTAYSVILTNSLLTPGTPLIGSTVPAGWVSTGEFLGTGIGSDGSPNGILPVAIGTGSVDNANFGLDRLPEGADYTAPSQLNPGGSTRIPVPAVALTGTDPEDGTYPAGLSGRKVTLYPAAEGILYYNNSPVTAPRIVNSFDPLKLKADPDDGEINMTFAYAVWDNASQADPAPDTVTLPFTRLTISGNVYNDANRLTDLTVNGTGTNVSGAVYANLVNNANHKVLESVPVSPGGNYTLGMSVLLNSSTGYSVILTNGPSAPGSSLYNASLPVHWIDVGENLGAGPGSDGSPDGKLIIGTISSSVSDANFGIYQLNNVPLAVNDTVYTTEDTPATGDASENDLPSVDGGNTWTLIGTNGGAAHGTVAMDDDGRYTYRYSGLSHFSGTDVFAYRVCDVDNDCSTASVTVIISSVGRPVARDDFNSTDIHTPVSGLAMPNDYDTYPIHVVPNSGTAGGIGGHFTIDSAGNYIYTPPPNMVGTATFTYELCNSLDFCDTAVVTIESYGCIPDGH